MDGTPTKPENEPQNGRSVLRQGNTPPQAQTLNLPPDFAATEEGEDDTLPGSFCLLTEDQTPADMARMIYECFGEEVAAYLSQELNAVWMKGGAS